jgi:hypothetical protein
MKDDGVRALKARREHCVPVRETAVHRGRVNAGLAGQRPTLLTVIERGDFDEPDQANGRGSDG